MYMHFTSRSLIASNLAVGKDPWQLECGGHVAVHPDSDDLGDGGEGGVGSEGRRKCHHIPHKLQLHSHQWRN